MDRRLVMGILLVALAIRLLAGFWWQQRLPADTRFGFGDSETYWTLAQTIARGEPYQTNPDRRVFRTPGYPLLLASVFCLVGDDPPVLWGRVLSAVLGTAAVGGVMWLTRLLFDQSAAILAGLAAACCPEAIATSAFVLSEAPLGPLVLAQLGLWTLAWRAEGRPAWRLAVASGLVAGAATLVRPSWLLFTPFALAIGILASRPRRRHVVLGAAMLAGLLVAMTPWWVRNARITGRFVPTTLQVGESLYDGWHPQATGASDMRFVDEFRRALRAEDARRDGGRAGSETRAQQEETRAQPGAGSETRAQRAETRAQPEETGAPQGSFEERLDRRQRDAAVAWARTHPGRVLQLAGIKFRRMWSPWPNEPSLRQPLIGLAVLVGYLPVLVGGLVGVGKFARRGWPYVLCFLPAVYLTGLHVVFVGSIRYRQPALLPLIVLAAGAVGPLLCWGRKGACVPAREQQ